MYLKVYVACDYKIPIFIGETESSGFTNELDKKDYIGFKSIRVKSKITYAPKKILFYDMNGELCFHFEKKAGFFDLIGKDTIHIDPVPADYFYRNFNS